MIFFLQLICNKEVKASTLVLFSSIFCWLSCCACWMIIYRTIFLIIDSTAAFKILVTLFLANRIPPRGKLNASIMLKPLRIVIQYLKICLAWSCNLHKEHSAWATEFMNTQHQFLLCFSKSTNTSNVILLLKQYLVWIKCSGFKT